MKRLLCLKVSNGSVSSSQSLPVFKLFGRLTNGMLPRAGPQPYLKYSKKKQQKEHKDIQIHSI